MQALILCVLFLTALCANDVVITQDGSIRGKIEANSRSFLGIPFAAPPVGDLRFQNPRPVTPWTGIKNTTQFAPACPQYCKLPPLCCPDIQSEDCLYMNVFTPLKDLETPKPVVVFIHGGHYDQGTGGSPLYDGANYVSMSDTILVTANYRLGVLGFLSTAASGLPGNYAFFDQLVVLKWVQANIRAFGGDPTRVTLVGESAGATSVGSHLISPLSKGLFRNAIMQSNPISIPMSDSKDALGRSDAFLRQVGCTDRNTELQCLKKLNVSSILAAQKQMIHIKLDRLIQVFLPWTPIVDGNVIPLHLLDAFATGAWTKMPLILGNDQSDATMFVYGVKEDSPLSLPEYYLVILSLFRNESNAIGQRYPAFETGDNRDLLSQLATDYIFTCPTRHISKFAVTQNVPVYLYLFNHSLSWDGWGPEFSYCHNKACHAVELPYQFSPQELHKIVTWTPAEFVLSYSLIAAWTNFAYTNDPNIGPMVPKQPITWPTWNPSTRQSFVFQTPTNRVATSLMNATCDFWDNLKGAYRFGW